MARVLCVDDDSNAVALKAAILESVGHVATSCGSVEEALFRLDTETFDAVITDWRLGEESGRTIVQAVKAKTNAPVLVVSGYVDEAFLAAKPLADIYLEKPVDAHELVRMLDTLLKSKLGGDKLAM